MTFSFDDSLGIDILKIVDMDSLNREKSMNLLRLGKLCAILKIWQFFVCVNLTQKEQTFRLISFNCKSDPHMDIQFLWFIQRPLQLPHCLSVCLPQHCSS